MLAYYGSKLSENITETPEGYLICRNVPIARTGNQEYLAYEIGLNNSNEIIRVNRPESEVFAPATLASFEGKPVTQEHPPDSVNPENYMAYARGHTQNVRRGSGEENDLILADLFISDPELIRLIRNGEMREVSCGYECEYAEDESENFYQRRIRGNHVAVVPAGRAGARVAIRDNAPENQERGKKTMTNKKKPSIFARAFGTWAKDADPEEVAGAIDEMIESNAPNDEETTTAPATPATEQKDDELIVRALTEMVTLMKGFGDKLDAVLASRAADESESCKKDEDPLQQLVDELTEPTAEKSGDAEGEESVTVPSDELPDETSDSEGEPYIAPESEKPENPIPGTDSRAAMLNAINAIKPVIARLPAAERKAATDALTKHVRSSMGKNRTAQSNNYAAINGIRRSASTDAAKRSIVKDDGQLGRDIMRKYNPHYKKGD